MHKTLIIKAFEEGKKRLEKKGIKVPSLTQIAEDIALSVEESEGLGLNEKSYRIYNTEALKIINTSEDISIKQLKVINGLCEYLGYANYEDFEFAHRDKSFKDHGFFFLKKYKGVLIISSLLIICAITFYSIKKQRWMIWAEDHYKEVTFKPEKLQKGDLKLYKKERIDNFKKIKTINCTTTIFFKSDGRVNLWYGKNINGDIELFTAIGLHPETGKTLKPITRYMIKKYLCPDY